MSNLTFSPLYVAVLPIAGLFSLNKSTIELAKPLVPDLGTIPGAALAQLELAQQKMGLGMNKAQKSALSQDVKALDKERDDIIAEIFRVKTSYLRSSDDIKKSAATTMHIFLLPYKGVASQPVNFETASVSDLVLKYKARPDLIAAATTLGIEGLFDRLDTKNKTLNDIYLNRNTEYAEREKAASVLKPEAVSAYIQFCTAIEQAVNFSPNDNIIALFNRMDEYRKKYHALEDGKVTPPEEAPAK